MEELRLLIEMVSHLPAMAMWVLVGFFAYKVAIVGSIYGVIRFVAGKLFDWLRAEKTKVEYREIRPVLDGMCVKAATELLIGQLHRLRGKGLSIPSEYIHEKSVDWLRDAIDDKIAKDDAEKKPSAPA